MAEKEQKPAYKLRVRDFLEAPFYGLWEYSKRNDVKSGKDPISSGDLINVLPRQVILYLYSFKVSGLIASGLETIIDKFS